MRSFTNCRGRKSFSFIKFLMAINGIIFVFLKFLDNNGKIGFSRSSRWMRRYMKRGLCCTLFVYMFWMSCRVASISSWSILFLERSFNSSSVVTSLRFVVLWQAQLLQHQIKNTSNQSNREIIKKKKKSSNKKLAKHTRLKLDQSRVILRHFVCVCVCVTGSCSEFHHKLISSKECHYHYITACHTQTFLTNQTELFTPQMTLQLESKSVEFQPLVITREVDS